MTAPAKETSPVATVGIGELSRSKFTVNMKHYKAVKSSTDFQNVINQVSSRKFKPLIQDFLATVLVFELHIFSRDSLVTFDSYQSEKIRNTGIVNRKVTAIWVCFTWRGLLLCVRFLQPW